MNNFDLHTPTRILFGKGAIENLRDQIPADARVLVTYGGGVSNAAAVAIPELACAVPFYGRQP
ncbi:hypothetical protein V7P28_44010, partial [Klebsiella michiganensis]